MVGTPVVEMRGTPHSHIMEPPPSSSSSSQSQAGIGKQRDKWPPGRWAVVRPRERAGTAATCALAHGWHICHRAQRQGMQEKRKLKQERGAHRFWQHSTVPGRGHGVPASTGELSPLQHWFCRAGPGHPSHPPFPSCTHCGIFWGERGSSRSRAGRVCLACSPGDGGQPLLSRGVCTYSCHQQEK